MAGGRRAVSGARAGRKLRRTAARPGPVPAAPSFRAVPRGTETGPRPRGVAGDGIRRAPAVVAVVLATVLSAVLAGAAPARADAIRVQEWALDALHLQEAWRTTRGAGVTVAVLDTGVDAGHPDLRGRVLPGKDLVGFGARQGDRTWARHGTAMAGIVAGRGHGDGDGDGVLGVAPEARILPVRVILEEGDPARAQARGARGGALADGVRWAADHGADVINLSLGDDSATAHPDAGEDAAVRYALAKGAVVVASAGNGGRDGDHASYPAAYPGVIAVTAVDRNGGRAAFSTRRWYATLSAPGVGVVIADPDRRYYEGWGTSAAAAFVSGAAALLRSAHPGLSPAEVRRLLVSSARDVPPGGRSDELGAGVVDPAAALALAARPLPGPPGPVGVAPRYFGAGPGARRAGAPDSGPGASVLGVGAVGSVLLAVAGVLWWRRGRVGCP
ncbi:MULTISPECIES: type VII secretion-associated serine protease mycosin [Streptomyces]|uniref:type VII secretion-associated serine protease mycosin n=1 Tax=Streptomyces TaxID=1883 RepID=UPI001EE568A0|nr:MULTISPECIES: type VII secretion-associated serine protease mycosin [Streptomyces]UKW32342.1 type VII secretion-associated serine protease mycosin [Streptomyces sp. TYQ1024]